MKFQACVFGILAFALFSLGSCATSSTPDTLGVEPFNSGDVNAQATSDAPPSTCDVVREAFLTGTAEDILKSLTALQADTSADATAREYADYYLHRDAGNPQQQEMDKGLIRMSCSN